MLLGITKWERGAPPRIAAAPPWIVSKYTLTFPKRQDMRKWLKRSFYAIILKKFPWNNCHQSLDPFKWLLLVYYLKTDNHLEYYRHSPQCQESFKSPVYMESHMWKTKCWTTVWGEQSREYSFSPLLCDPVAHFGIACMHNSVDVFTSLLNWSKLASYTTL